MGIGSYGINNDNQKAVCIDCMDFEQFDYDDIESNIVYALPKSFSPTKGWNDNHAIIAENNLFTVELCGHDCDTGLRVVCKDNDYINLAQHNLDKTAKLIFDKVSEMYSLRVKTSGYTSSPYKLTA